MTDDMGSMPRDTNGASNSTSSDDDFPDDDEYPPNMRPMLHPDYKRNLQKRLKFLFMNPCGKFVARRKCPFKLSAQLLKIVFVTIQLTSFGFSRSGHVNFLEKSTLALRHMYLKEWEPTFETLPYPPAIGVYAIYTIPDFYNYVNFAMKRYDNTQRLAIGSYHFSDLFNGTHTPMWMCKNYYRKGKINATSETYKFDARHKTDCFDLHTVKACNATGGNCTEKYDVEQFLHLHNKSINFDRIIEIGLNFTMKTVHLKELSQMSSPDCYEFDVRIKFQNAQHNGQMAITLDLQEQPLECNGKVVYDAGHEFSFRVLSVCLDVIVILISLFSCGTCLRSISRAEKLRRETRDYFRMVLFKKLSMEDMLEFLNLWYIIMVLNDILAVIGSVAKILIEAKVSHSYEWAGVTLGMANLLVWFGVLRYLGFFSSYNVLILTMKKAAPSILRFLVCASVFYFGFALCGWVVLGPYHVKFRDLSTASECLFSLVNGDDMFVTFSVIKNFSKPTYIWWFSRIYLYSFVSLFIYVVLNLFVAVILDTFNVLNQCYITGFPKTALHDFIDESPDFTNLQMSDRHIQGCGVTMCCILASGLCPVGCCCDRCKEEDNEDDDEVLINVPT